MFSDIPWKATHVHVKTGGLYQVFGVGTDTEFGAREVLYRSSPTHPDPDNRNRIWVRDASEFYDGRFRGLSENSPTETEILGFTTRAQPRQVLFVVSSTAIGRSVSRNSHIPLILHAAVLRDLKGLGPAAILPLDIIADYDGLHGIGDCMLLVVEDASDPAFAEPLAKLRRMMTPSEVVNG